MCLSIQENAKIMKLNYFFIIFFFATGCSPISPYKQPTVYAPLEWKKETNPEIEKSRDTAFLNDWWTVFDDPVLNELEYIAIENNQSLKAAMQNYMQAKAESYIARAPLFPSIYFAPLFEKSEGVLNVSQFNLNNTNAPDPCGIRGVIAQHTVPFNFNYQVDLWSQIRNGYIAALLTEEAALEGFNALLLTITADIADNYFILRSLDSEREILVESQIIRKNAVEINQARYDAGLVNYTDVSRAITEYANVNADFEDMLRQRSIQEDIIAMLSGLIAPEFSLAFSPLHDEPPLIPAGIPASIIVQRPDIRQKERLLASSWSNIAVQYANYLPSLNLAGSIGYSTPCWSQLLDWKSRFWSYTVSIMQMVFDGGLVTGEVKLAKAIYLENLANYQQNVLVAFQEVEDALAGIKYRDSQSKYLKESFDAARDTLNLSQERYDRGIVTYLDVVDAERSLLDSQRAYVRAFGSRYTSTVDLIRSLGGRF